MDQSAEKRHTLNMGPARVRLGHTKKHVAYPILVEPRNGEEVILDNK